jgi:DNA (cytosine-5)-methyltransferase 1
VDTTKAITHLSLCSGYSGIGIGLKRVLPNLREVAHVEIETYAIANLVAKMEEGRLAPSPIYTDVKTFPYKRFSGCVDILSGGFPCQPFSSAGNRKGVEDDRHLYPYISKGISECKPGIVFLENVEGIISSKTADGESVLKYVLRDLEGMGYRATAGVFSASEVGAPHQRKRVFILAYSIGERSGGKQSSASSRVDEKICEIAKERPTEYNVRGKAEGCGRELADTNNSRGYEDRQPSELRTEGTEQSSRDSWQTNKGERCKELSNTNGQGLEGSIQDNHTQRWEESNGQLTSGCGFPARPNEYQYEWEEPRTKPKLGGTTDGYSSRVDRLRLLGNGVVPATAAKAFVTLLGRLVD